MPALAVGATPVPLVLENTDRPIIQNLGPDDLFWGRKSTVTAETGILIAADTKEAYEFSRPLVRSGSATLYLVSAGDSDVRYEKV